jgi:hypothetical protein
MMHNHSSEAVIRSAEDNWQLGLSHSSQIPSTKTDGLMSIVSCNINQLIVLITATFLSSIGNANDADLCALPYLCQTGITELCIKKGGKGERERESTQLWMMMMH